MLIKSIKYFIVSLLLSLNLTAQVYFFKKYTTSDGLVQGTVRVISQDSYGRMWFGTAEGLSIYDGSSFYNFGIDEGLPVPVISSFLEITPGVMLVGTLGSGIAVFEKTPFKKDTITAILSSKKYLINPYVSQITRDNDGNIWIYTDGGTTEWIYNDGIFSKVIHKPQLGKLGKINIYRAIFADSSDCYFATDLGLVKKHNNQYDFVYHNLSHKQEPVFWVFRDNDNRIWFPTLNKLYYLKEDKVTDFSESHPEITSPSVAYCEDKYGNLRIGVLGKLYLFKKKQLKIIDDQNGLHEKNIISLFSDKENNLWIGSLEGISKLTNMRLKFIKNGDLQTFFTSMVTNIGNKLLIGTNLDLYEIKDFNLVSSDLTRGIGKVSYNSLVLINNNMWFATDKGVYRKNKNGIRLFTTKDGLPNNYVYNLNVDSSGIVWIATQSGLAYYKNSRIFNFNDKTETSWKFSDEESKHILSSISIRWLIVDGAGSVWVGSWDSGLFRIKDNSIFRFTQKEGLTDLHIRGLYIDSRKKLWVGTRYGGAFIFENGRFSQMSVKDGISSNWIFSILEDDLGNFWFSTANGINKFDGYNWSKIDASEGITSGEIKFSTKVGKDLWFGSWSQVFCYHTDYDSVVYLKPEIFFSQIRLMNGNLPDNKESRFGRAFSFEKLGKPIDLKKKITELDYNNNSIVLEFAGTSFRDESKIKYDYILEGFENNWTKSTKRNYATYTHLPAGDYTFKVYAINGDGLKSDLPALFYFKILPPFWQTWWFIVISIFSTLFITSIISILIYRNRINQKLRVERLRTKISSDLHDEIGTSLSSISIFSELVKREIKDDASKSREMLERIENTSRNLIDKMSDIVWVINPQNDRLEDAILKIREYSVKLLESREIDVKINIPEEVFNITLTMDVRSNLLMIFKEIVTNAAKYSFAKSIDINFNVTGKGGNKYLVLNVKDDGVGFDTKAVSSGNGLRNISRRAKDINALYRLESSPGKGTNISLEIILE
jgi:ligand-binding sensor domain-containing protein/two-component sensor histidine kinase